MIKKLIIFVIFLAAVHVSMGERMDSQPKENIQAEEVNPQIENLSTESTENTKKNESDNQQKISPVLQPEEIDHIDFTEEKTDLSKQFPLTDKKRLVYIIPIQGPISKPTLYILRRGLKDAISEGVDTIALDMNTPGGRLDVTLEMMEILDNFEGDTITFVNNDAISAGAYISIATEDIYFSPKGVIGAAAVVQSTGKEIDKSMKMKIDSYLRAKVRSVAGDGRYRADVLRAMMDDAFELKIGEKVIKTKDELLSLTANEAIETYGDPPQKLLGVSIVKDINALLTEKYGKGNFAVTTFEVTWSESLAQFMDKIAPILIGLGMLCLFIEFKTPGFGIFGISGIIIIAIVFISNYVAGLAGYEPMLVFMAGMILLGLELFVFPGTLFMGLLGIVLILGSLIWSLADIWPTSGGGISINPDHLWYAIYRTGIGLTISIIGLVLIWKILPKTSLWSNLVLSDVQPQPGFSAATRDTSNVGNENSLPDIGTEGITVTDMMPSGEVEIQNKRYQASVKYGILRRGDAITVTGYKDFSLLVDKLKS